MLARTSHYLVKPILRSVPLGFGAIVLLALGIGWLNREEGHLTPESGTGYWLGIVGASMMLLLMLYPLRKRMKLLRHLGRVPDWFRLHMVLGILGPTLILFHSNFKLGSLNSNIALTVMLVVVGSGIVGRFLYAKVHLGLYGRKATVSEIVGDAQVLKQVFGDDLGDAERIIGALRAFEAEALKPRSGVLRSLGAFLLLGRRAHRCRRHVLRIAEKILSQHAQQRRWSRRERSQHLKLVRKEIATYFAAVDKAARFAVFERLLALWHLLHFPLFLLLVVTALVHVLAVHLY